MGKGNGLPRIMIFLENNDNTELEMIFAMNHTL